MAAARPTVAVQWSLSRMPAMDRPEAAADPAAGQQVADQLQALTQRLDEQQAQLDKMAQNGSFDPEAAGALQQQSDRLHARHPSRFRRFIIDGVEHTILAGNSALRRSWKAAYSERAITCESTCS